MPARMNVRLCSGIECHLQEPGQHSGPAECASDAHAVPTDIEDLAPATPTKPVAAVLLGSPLTPVGCTPMDMALPTASLAAVHAKQASAKFEQAAQPKQPDCAEDVEAELSTPRVDRTSSFAGCASAAQSVEDVVETLLTAKNTMHQAETEGSALQHPDRFDLSYCPIFVVSVFCLQKTRRTQETTQRTSSAHVNTCRSVQLCLHAAVHSQTHDACPVAVCILVVLEPRSVSMRSGE